MMALPNKVGSSFLKGTLMPAKVRLKPLKEQIIVLTGASSGIGLVTARLAAEQGARLILAARSEQALRTLESEINSSGGEALAVVADVGKEEDVRHIADAAVTRFGGFDTWINDASVSIYGKMMEVPIEDHRRLFETNFWGMVYGSLIAAEQLRRRGGALINIGSTVSDRAIPLQGMYSASKHAIKGFTDALRMELEADNAPVSITLIKPGSINTPFPRHAKNYMQKEATLPPPVYAPDVVARAILHCCEIPERDVFVGGGGKMISATETLSPRLTDYMMEHSLERMQQKDAPPTRRDSLFAPSEDLAERGDYEGHVMESSAYTQASLHPWITGALVAGATLAVAALLRESDGA
jgi:short-subunit dehydrogenase